MAIVGSRETIAGREIAILVEVDDPPAGASIADWLDEGDEARGERVDRLLDATRDVFGEGLALIRDSAARAVDSYNEMSEDLRPDHFELQLAIKLDVEAGAFVTKLGAGAQMQVTMAWNKRLAR